jgi:nucleolar protein 15
MSKITHEAAQTRKRVRDSAATEESESQRIKMSSVIKKTNKKADVSGSEEMEITDETDKVATGKGKSSAQKKKAAAQKKKSIEDKKIKHAAAVSSVVYLGHIPHGFYEKEISKFFNQFGEIKRVKLFRSEKTNGSKGYAFIQFAEPDVALTAAQSMDGYFLSERQLVCQLIPASKLHRGMFARVKAKTEIVEVESAENSALVATLQLVAEVSEESKEKKAKRFLKDQNSKQRKLRAMGIDFDLFQATSI